MLLPDKHEYIGCLTGERRRSVTTILEEEGLITGKHFYYGNAAEIGTEVHRMIDAYNKGWILRHIPDLYKPYLALWQGFVAHLGAQVIASEVEVENPRLGYSGTLDTLLEVKGQVWLVDLKNTSGGYQPWHEYQTEAYRQALAHHPDYKNLVIFKRMGLILRRDAGLPVYIPHNRIGDIGKKWISLCVGNAAKHEVKAIAKIEYEKESQLWG
jgi:hypothetical protein